MTCLVKDIIESINKIKSICLDYEYTDSLSCDILKLLSEVIDRLKWITLRERMSGVWITEEQYEQLLEYKQMYEDLCK